MGYATKFKFNVYHNIKLQKIELIVIPSERDSHKLFCYIMALLFEA